MTLRFLAPAGGGTRAPLAPWVRLTAAALLVCGCTPEPVPRIPPPREQLQIAFAAIEAHRARLSTLVLERYPQYFWGSADGRTLVTLMLDGEGHVTASDFVNSPSHWFAGPGDFEPERFSDRAFEFLASHGVPLEQARASTSLFDVKPPKSRFYVSPPSPRPVLTVAVYDPARRMAFERFRLGASPEAVRAIVTRHFPELYESPRSRGGATREWIWALMDSRGDLLTAGREPEPPDDGRERAGILEARYPGVEISESPFRVGIPGLAGQSLRAPNGAPLMLTVYWLDPGSPLP